MYPRTHSEQVTYWDELYAELTALDASSQTVFVDSITEPTYGDWAAAWVAKGYDLPIPAGSELYWHRKGQLWGMYSVLEGDRFTPIAYGHAFAQGMAITPVEDNLFIGIGTPGSDPGYVNTNPIAYNVQLVKTGPDGSPYARYPITPYSYIARENATPAVHYYSDNYERIFALPAIDSVVAHRKFIGTGGTNLSRILNMNVGAGGFIRQASSSIIPTGLVARFHAILGNLTGSSMTVRATCTNAGVSETFFQDFVVPANSVGVYEFTFTPLASWAAGCVVTISIAAGSGAGEVFQVGEIGLFYGAAQNQTAIINGHFRSGVTFATNYTQSGTTAATTAVAVQYHKTLRFNYETNVFTREIMARASSVTEDKLKGVKPDGTKYLFDGTLVWTRGGNAAGNFQALTGVGFHTNDPDQIKAIWVGSRIFTSQGYVNENNTGGVALVNHHIMFQLGNYIYFAVQGILIGDTLTWWADQLNRINVNTLAVELDVDNPYPNFEGFLLENSSEEPPSLVSTRPIVEDWNIISFLRWSFPSVALDSERLFLIGTSGGGSGFSFASIYSENSTGKVWRVDQYTDPIDDIKEVERFFISGAAVNGRTIDLASVQDDEDYDHLLLMIEPETQTGASYIHIQFNGDATPANYDTFFLRLSGATVNNEEILGATRTGIAIPTGVNNAMPHNVWVLIMDYKNTTRWKQALIFGGVTLNVTANNIRNLLGHGVWENTAEILNVRVDDDGTNVINTNVAVRLCLLRGRGRFNRDGVYDSGLA